MGADPAVIAASLPERTEHRTSTECTGALYGRAWNRELARPSYRLAPPLPLTVAAL